VTHELGAHRRGFRGGDRLLRGGLGRDCLQRRLRNEAQKMFEVDGVDEVPVKASDVASLSIPMPSSETSTTTVSPS